MNAAAITAVPTQTVPKYRQKESSCSDATFLRIIEDNLFSHDREMSAIHLRAYRAILNGENLPDIRFRYDREMDAYLDRHMWDD